MEFPPLLYQAPGSLQPYDLYIGQSSVLGEPLEDPSNMHSNIDPLLESYSPSAATFAPGPWGHQQQQQVQRFLDDGEKTAFFNAPPTQPVQLHQQLQQHQRQHHSVLSSITQSPLHQQRWGSPFSSPEHGSSCSSALSPPGDSEIFHESGPATPHAGVDFIVAPPHHSKHQQPPAGSHTPPPSFWGSPPPLSANDYVAATGMPGYVNPLEINPDSQVDFDDFHSGSGIHTNYSFESPERGFTLQSTSSASFDIDFSFKATSVQEEALSSTVKPEIVATAAYQSPSPLKQEAIGFEIEHTTNQILKVEDHEQDQDSDDSSDFTPTKTGKASTRSRPAVQPKRKQAPKRSSRSAIQADDKPTSPKRPRRQSDQVNVTLASPLLSSATAPESPSCNVMLSQAAHGHLTCKDCAQSTSFKTQTALDAHIKKQHKRPFVCVFAFAGCESTFASKNEWKRHVVSQHILLNYWICTQDACAKTVNSAPLLVAAPSSSDPASGPQRVASSSLRGRNSPAISPASSLATALGATGQYVYGPRLPDGAIFNRKDLYTQHVRRMHTPDKIKKQHKTATSSSSAPASLAHISSHRRKSSSASTPIAATAMSASAAADEGEVAAWEQRVRHLQQGAEMERCQLPKRMSCPAPGCVATFESSNAWDERMEHLAKHLEAAARGDEQPVHLAGGPGAQPDRSLIEWASRPDVAIIVPCGGGGNTGLPPQWVLNNPLKPTGVAVMAAAAAAAAAASTVTPASSAAETTVVLGEIIVDTGEEDAEGEDDDFEV